MQLALLGSRLSARGLWTVTSSGVRRDPDVSEESSTTIFRAKGALSKTYAEAVIHNVNYVLITTDALLVE
jgi:hypothetical protein